MGDAKLIERSPLTSGVGAERRRLPGDTGERQFRSPPRQVGNVTALRQVGMAGQIARTFFGVQSQVPGPELPPTQEGPAQVSGG